MLINVLKLNTLVTTFIITSKISLFTIQYYYHRISIMKNRKISGEIRLSFVSNILCMQRRGQWPIVDCY